MFLNLVRISERNVRYKINENVSRPGHVVMVYCSVVVNTHFLYACDHVATTEIHR